jgi:chemotaxis protein methyltransferase CheR
VTSRLNRLLPGLGLSGYSDLVSKLAGFGNSQVQAAVIDAMTTNETSFFRDLHPFEAMKNVVIPDLLKKRESTRQLNLWCGASSSGQEPYSVAMMLLENFPQLTTWKVHYVASDISEKMLARCREGIYSQLEVNRGLPAPLLVKYFDHRATKWQIKDNIRKWVDFKQINLASHWPHLPRMDIVFMRNVLIYFDPTMKKIILGKIRQILKPDGYLFLGAAETTLNLDDAFQRMDIKQSGCYRLREGQAHPSREPASV